VIKEKKRGRGRWKACGLRRDRATSTATICLEAHASASVAGMGNVGACNDVDKNAESGERKEMKE
jgi:hypothetical protein